MGSPRHGPGRRCDAAGHVTRRVNAFTVLAAIVAVLTVAAGSRILLRLHGASGPAVVGARPTDEPRDPSRLPPRAATPTAGPAVAWSAPPTADRPTLLADAAVALKKRNLLALVHDQRLLEEADEQAFDSLHLPETSRLSVRKVNDEWGEKRRALLSAGDDGRTPEQTIADAEAGNADLDLTRRTALGKLLGGAMLGQFEAAEGAALSRRRDRFRAWGERAGAAGSPPVDLAER